MQKKELLSKELNLTLVIITFIIAMIFLILTSYFDVQSLLKLENGTWEAVEEVSGSPRDLSSTHKHLWVTSKDRKSIDWFNGVSWKNFKLKKISSPNDRIKNLKNYAQIAWIETEESLLQFNGKSWKKHDSIIAPYDSIEIAVTARKVWVLGSETGLKEFDGKNWREIDLPEKAFRSLFSLSTFNGNLILKNNSLWVYEKDAWIEIIEPELAERLTIVGQSNDLFWLKEKQTKLPFIDSPLKGRLLSVSKSNSQFKYKRIEREALNPILEDEKYDVEVDSDKGLNLFLKSKICRFVNFRCEKIESLPKIPVDFSLGGKTKFAKLDNQKIFLVVDKDPAPFKGVKNYFAFIAVTAGCLFYFLIVRYSKYESKENLSIKEIIKTSHGFRNDDSGNELKKLSFSRKSIQLFFKFIINALLFCFIIVITLCLFALLKIIAQYSIILSIITFFAIIYIINYLLLSPSLWSMRPLNKPNYSKAIKRIQLIRKAGYILSPFLMPYALSLKGDLKNAEEEYQNIITRLYYTKNNKNLIADAHCTLLSYSRLHLWKGNFDLSRSEFDIAIEILSPISAKLEGKFLEAELLLEENGDHFEAEEILNSINKYFFKYATLFHPCIQARSNSLKARVGAKKNNSSEVESLFDKTKQFKRKGYIPEYAHALRNFGKAFEEIGDLRQAKEICKMILDIDPDGLAAQLVNSHLEGQGSV